MATATKKKSKGKSTQQIHDEVTDRIIAALEEGTVPWQRPWKVIGGLHSNWKSQKNYRGINQFLLDITAQAGGYRSPYWLTFNQAKDESYRQYREKHGVKDSPEAQKAYRDSGEYKGVRAGEESTLVVFWKILKFDKKDENGRPIPKVKGTRRDNVKVTVPLLRYYRVFNSEQTDLGIEPPNEDDLRDHTPIEEAQSIIDNCPKRPEIFHRGDRAFYLPPADAITLPQPEQFESDEAYYATAFHELVHATGHESRTGRVEDWSLFGSDPYAKEELVAEIGAAILASHSGIESESLHKNTAAYVQSWIKRFKEDHTLLMGAGSKAQAAVDYILDTKFDNNDNNDKEQ
jgi:antirestriction protein ArdC